MTPDRQVIIAVDVVNSTRAKEDYGEQHGIQMIAGALDLATDYLRTADPSLQLAGASAGDSILLIGGSDPVGLYKASVIRQAIFRAWPDNQLAVKIAMDCGEFRSEDSGGFTHHRGRRLDYLHRILEMCPPGRCVIGPSLFISLRDAGFHAKVTLVRGELKGMGEQSWYESDGEYQIEIGQRPRARTRKTDFDYTAPVEPHQLVGANVLAIVLVLYALLTLGVVVYFHIPK